MCAKGCMPFLSTCEAKIERDGLLDFLMYGTVLPLYSMQGFG